MALALQPAIIKPENLAHETNRHSDHFNQGTLSTIVIAHDYLCPWCWVALFQAQRLTEQFGVTFDWRGYELIPPGMEGPDTAPKPAEPAPAPSVDEAPKPPSRFDLFAQAEGVPVRKPGPPFARTHLALLGAEFAREQGLSLFDAYNEAVYRAFWEQHAPIGDLETLANIAQSAGLDRTAFITSLQAEQYDERVVPFDDEAYGRGVRHVPTFIFGAEERLAEAPYQDLANATERFLHRLERHRKAGRL